MNMPGKGDVMQAFSVFAVLAALMALAGGVTDRPAVGHWERAPLMSLLP